MPYNTIRESKHVWSKIERLFGPSDTKFPHRSQSYATPLLSEVSLDFCRLLAFSCPRRENLVEGTLFRIVILAWEAWFARWTSLTWALKACYWAKIRVQKGQVTPRVRVVIRYLNGISGADCNISHFLQFMKAPLSEYIRDFLKEFGSTA